MIRSQQICFATANSYEMHENGALFPGYDFFENFEFISKLLPISSAFKNSLIVSLTSTLLTAYLGGLTARYY
ncbi:hypothetical protein Bccel_2904 [Pseudobacteroides cellulosolvens ATCC 35603 = DSM 2933]|uniref:Uncharacterized protein n=1 Tax=Pseudobacteroides cellulosolvens ATCC 35603 = DSM 2933 TaxID=398512 RepID=A0A0L6JPC2_9FIRM|nr:hypothetical protein [Pseudobacteroides cellulosolvens]KNY27633.1 hypothetical protein Bccel_2904 [Pseudobacteroides cellulosolvens ATCC 35603 = DSM 2933]